MPGLFIVFEGPDGAGTTKHAALLTQKLESAGMDVVSTAEPTMGTHGKRIREMLKSGGATNEHLQELFAADRREHIAQIILPNLKEGKVVIADRYVPSTLVYGEAQGIPLEKLQTLNKNFIRPDLLFLLLPPFEVSWSRVAKRKARDSFEQEQFQRKVYEGYLRYSSMHPEAIVIDTSGTKEESAERIWGKAREYLQNRSSDS